MKISKKSILEVFIIFKSVYPEFEKRMQDEQKGKETVEAWKEVFKTIDFDYESANADFIEGAKRVVSKSKYIPTIAEISEEMKIIHTKRIEKLKNEMLWQLLDIEEKCKLKNTDTRKAINIYYKLNKIYSDKEIISKINKYREMEKIGKSMILNTEDILEKIVR